jgi:hypothetical protein
MKRLILVALGIVLTTAACNNGSSTTATSPSSPATNTYDFSGTVPAPVNGVPQSVSIPFTVGQSGGNVTAILTAAVETYAPGSGLPPNPAVVMSLYIGSPSGATCTIAPGELAVVEPASASSGQQGALNPGNYCVGLSSDDLSTYAGPVAYTVVVQSP